MSNTEVKRYGLNGEYTHSDYYDDYGNKVGSSVDRYDWSGKYSGTDNYDKHGNKTGSS